MRRLSTAGLNHLRSDYNLSSRPIEGGFDMDSHWLRSLAVVAAALALASPSAAHASTDHDIEVPEVVEACLSCHAFKPGEPELEGPTLWGVVGRRIAGAPDYAYSDALRGQPGTWDRATLDRFLESPQAFAPGLNMTLGGVKNAADRKAVLDFLESLTDREDD
jgi:cytochrome c